MKGLTVNLTRGRLTFRAIDNQLSCLSYMGTITDDPKYPFPIYKDIIEVKGSESERPESEIIAARKAAKK